MHSRFMRWFLQLLLAGLVPIPSAATPRTLSFELKAGLIFVAIESQRSNVPLDFILDTGANVSVLNLATANHLGVRLPEPVPVHGVDSTVTGYWPVKMQARLGDIPLPARFLSVDLGALSTACASTIDGLIGADFFHGKIVQLDFRTRTLRILENFNPGPAEVTLPLKQAREAILVAVQVDGGRPQWVRLDTGCASPLEWVDNARAAGATKSEISIGLAAITKTAKPKNVRIGPFSFRDVETGLHAKPIFKGERGLLGMGLLSRFALVTIDCPGRRLALQTKG